MGQLTAAGRRRLASAAWWGGMVVTKTGETVTVNVSDSYAVDSAVAQAWADYFASLVHGPELGLVSVYVAPLAEVEASCGGEGALGCYANQRLVMVGDSSGGIAPTLVAAHEYGHHIAHNRLNPPWRALAWGTKRWASAIGVCPRAMAGTLFPGDEGRYYQLNPGEAFAEVYRALNESKGGAASFVWPVVDSSFYPDAAALRAVEQDVLEPWAAPTTRVARGRFLARGKATWTLRLETPLDGELGVAVSLPRGALYDVALVSSDGRTVLARGLWSGTRSKTLGYTICGQRSLQLRVTRRGAAGRFAAGVTQP